MFDELNNVIVRLMLDLSRENIGNVSTIRSRIERIDLQELYDLCVQHEMDGVVASNIIKNDVCVLPKYWIKKYEDEKRHLKFLKDKACEICKKMDENGIKMVILKNGGIMCDMISDEAACPMEDIDSLVKKSDFLKAHDILIENGLSFKFRSEYEKEEILSAYGAGSTEYFIETPEGKRMWFELAWRAVAGRWIRQDLEPNTNELIDHAYFAGKTKVGILSPEDNLLQVCVHTAKHSYVRAPGLRLHLDVERIVSHQKINWDLFVKKVCDAHVKTSTYFSLYLANYLFETKIPKEVLSKLCPSKVKRERILRLISNAGLLYPERKKFSKLQFLCFQTSLYDRVSDMLYVVYPKNNRLHEMYGYASTWKTPYYLMINLFDLMGIRKKKK